MTFPLLKVVTRCGFRGDVKLATILLFGKPGASVIAPSFATSSDALDHIPLNTSLGSPISFQETERGGTFSDTVLVFEDVCTSSAKYETGCYRVLRHGLTS